MSEGSNFERTVGDEVAGAWERHRDRLFEGQRPLSDWIVERIDPQPGQTVLELTAGPGETGFLVAPRVQPGGRVISSDVSPAMVDAARRGAAAAGLDNVECRVIDAGRIDLDDDSVDAVISRFGLMFVPDPATGFGEMRRVLRPGGRLAYGVWGGPDRNPWITVLVGAVLEHGHVPGGDPFGAGGVFSLAEPERNAQLLATAGFDGIEIQEHTTPMLYADANDYWDVQTSIAGTIVTLLASLSADERSAIRATLESNLEPYRVGDHIELPSLALAVSAN